MTKKAIIVVACAIAALFANGAANWKNLDDASYISGPKLAEGDLIGKVVLVYYWDTVAPTSFTYFPEVEKMWSAFKAKKFVAIGSFVGVKVDDKVKEAIKTNKVTFPVYHHFGIKPPAPGGPGHIFIVNHRGSVVVTSTNIKAVTEAVANAIGAIGMPISLCGDVELKKFKSLEKQLTLGKNVTSVLKSLEKQLKSKDSGISAEAQEIISAVERAKNDVKEDIALYREVDPAEAVKLINLFTKTWPKDDSVQEFKDAVPELKKAAAEKAKTAKEKGKKVST